MKSALGLLFCLLQACTDVGQLLSLQGLPAMVVRLQLDCVRVFPSERAHSARPIILRLCSDTGHEVTICLLLFALVFDAISSRAEHCQLACFFCRQLFKSHSQMLLEICFQIVRSRFAHSMLRWSMVSSLLEAVVRSISILMEFDIIVET